MPLLILAALLFAGPGYAGEPPSRLVIATPSPIDTLDPHVVLDTRRADVRRQLYDGLFRWQDGPLRIAPWLARSYTVSEDGRTFRFTLREGARFHDGRDVQASDVVYSVERLLALKRGVAPLLAGLLSPGSTKAIDVQTVEFSLSRASPLFLALLPEMAIVNAELLKTHEVNNDWGRGWLQTNDAGSGAFSLKAVTPGGGIVIERFAEHWSDEDRLAPPIAEVELRTVLDPEQRVAGLLKGELHVLQGDLLPDQLRRLRKADTVSLLDNEGPRAFIGLLHAGRDPMKATAFRRILALSFDADRFIASTLPEGATAIDIPLPPALGIPAQGVERPRFDLAAATEELARLKPTLPRELVIGAIAGDPHSERAALIMLEGLLHLGIAARIVSEPWPQVATRMRDEKLMFDVLFLWRSARYFDANNWLGEMYDCDLFGQGNASWYCNRDIDRLIKEARGAVDLKARRIGFEKAAALLAEDYAGLFIAAAPRPLAHANRVQGLRLSPVGQTLDLWGATLK